MSDLPLINAETLIDELDNPKVKVFDIRGVWGSPPVHIEEKYLSAHIPGAVYLNWLKHFIEIDVPVEEASVASKEQAQRSFETLGISKDDSVILYDDYNHMFACRVWWAMQYWGFSNVIILNGGWQYWVDNGFPVSTEAVTPLKGDFSVSEKNHFSVSTSHVEDTLKESVLIDARGEPGYLKEHIPGAINIPFRTMLDEKTGLFKDCNSLESLFSEQLGDWKNKKIISSCGSGYAGTVVLVAMLCLGVWIPLYDGSYTMWKKNKSEE